MAGGKSYRGRNQNLKGRSKPSPTIYIGQVKKEKKGGRVRCCFTGGEKGTVLRRAPILTEGEGGKKTMGTPARISGPLEEGKTRPAVLQGEEKAGPADYLYKRDETSCLLLWFGGREHH